MDKVVNGYILRSANYKEADNIITLLTKDGLVNFKARGVLKPTSKNAFCIQNYIFGEYCLSSKVDGGHELLTNGVIKDSIKDLYTNLDISVILGLLSESICKIEEYDYKEAYHIFECVFNSLKEDFDFATIVLVILKYAIYYSGCMLESDGCVICGSVKNIECVSYNDGGYICHNCNLELHSPRQSTIYLKNYRYVLKAKPENITQFKVDVSVGYQMVVEFFNHLEQTAGIYLKSKELVLTSLKK